MERRGRGARESWVQSSNFGTNSHSHTLLVCLVLLLVSVSKKNLKNGPSTSVKSLAECHWRYWSSWSETSRPCSHEAWAGGVRGGLDWFSRAFQSIRIWWARARACTGCSVSLFERSLLLLAVLVLLAVGGEALGLQQLGGGFSLAKGALVVLQEPLLLLQGGLLVCVEALQLLEAALELRRRRCEDGLDVIFWVELKGGGGGRNWHGPVPDGLHTSLSASFSSDSFSFTLCTNICLISSSLLCSSTTNSWRLAS